MSHPPMCDYHLAIQEGREPKTTRCKFFEIGMNRTGSRSIYIAADMLGLKAMHSTGGCPKCSEDAASKITQNKSNLVVYKIYDYVGHLASHHWKQLADNRPDAKFILPIRPIDAWAESAFERTRKQRHRGQKMSRAMRMGWFDSLHPSKEQLKKVFQKHIDDVLSYFNPHPDRLLIMNVFGMSDEDLWDRLSNFVNTKRPEPFTEFPHRRTAIFKYRITAPKYLSLERLKKY